MNYTKACTIRITCKMMTFEKVNMTELTGQTDRRDVNLWLFFNFHSLGYQVRTSRHDCSPKKYIQGLIDIDFFTYMAILICTSLFTIGPFKYTQKNSLLFTL